MTLHLDTAFVEGELALATIEVTLDGACNRLELVVPENTPVRVSTDGFVNLVDHRSSARTPSGPAYRLRSEGAFNRVVIRSE